MTALKNCSKLKDQLYSLGRAQPRDAVRPKAKREVRWEDESPKPVDTGASASNNPTIRVLNHKDYKIWKVRNGSICDYSSITGFFFNYCSYFRKTQPNQKTFLLITIPNKLHTP